MNEYGPYRCTCFGDKKCAACREWREVDKEKRKHVHVLRGKHDEIVFDYTAGMTRGEIGEKYGVSKWVVAEYLRDEKITKKGLVRVRLTGKLESMKEEIAADFNAGMSLRTLALKYGTARSWMRRFLITRGYRCG